jgi:hypothetical protein
MQIWLVCRNDVVIMKLDYFLLVFWHHFVGVLIISSFFLYCVKLFDVDSFPSPETDLQLSNQCFFFVINFAMLPHWLVIVHKETSYEYKNSSKSFYVLVGYLLEQCVETWWSLKKNLSTLLLKDLEKRGSFDVILFFWERKIRRMATICQEKNKPVPTDYSLWK